MYYILYAESAVGFNIESERTIRSQRVHFNQSKIIISS